MEKEIITSFIIIAQIEVSAGEAFQVILCVSFELVSLTCLGVSKQKPTHEKDYYLSVRFGCPFFWQVCWMCGWKTFGFCSIGSSEKLALAVSIMWYELSSVGFYFIFFISYKNVWSEMHILLLNLSWVFVVFEVQRFVCL